MRVYEKINKFKFGVFQIRVWQQSYYGCSADSGENLESLVEQIARNYHYANDVAENIANINNVNAVEVIDLQLANDGGVIVYNDWP